VAGILLTANSVWLQNVVVQLLSFSLPYYDSWRFEVTLHNETYGIELGENRRELVKPAKRRDKDELE
jgi:hypothetical protein